MAPDSDFDALVAPLREDNVSGASELSRTAAEVLRRAAIRLQAGSVDELRWGLGQVSQKIMAAQPSMAPMGTLIRQVLEAVESTSALDDARLAAANAAEDFTQGFEERVRLVVASAANVLPAGGTVATLSSSGTVRALLASEAGPRGIRVVCFESRPIREGRELAAALAREGVEVVYAVDAALEALIPQCDAVLFGADAIGDDGVVNKIGSSPLARAARTRGIPVYVLADRTKLLPRGHPPMVEDDRPAAEVWDDVPHGIRVWNRYFEIMPLELMTGLVCEDGVLSPGEVEELRSRL